jgi:hypothetical protein
MHYYALEIRLSFNQIRFVFCSNSDYKLAAINLIFSVRNTFQGALSSDSDVGHYVTIKLLQILGLCGR